MTTEAAWIQADALGPDPVVVRSLEGRDELNQQYSFRAHVELPGVLGNDEVEALLNGRASLVFRQDLIELNRFFAIVSDVTIQVDSEHARTDLFVELRPVSWLLSLRRGTEIFMGQSIPETIADKLASAGLDPKRDFGFSLHESYSRREFTVQHEETDLAFVMRLAEDIGLATCFQERDGGDGWVFTDSSAAFASGPRPFLHVRTRAEHPAAYNLRRTLRRVPSDVVAHDYNYRTPRLALSAQRPVSRPAASGTWVEFANDPKTEAEVDEVARRRAEELAGRHDTTEGVSTDASLRAGRIVELRDAAGGQSQLLITHVWYGFRAGDPGSVGWENRFRGIPLTVRFRPPRVTPIPKVPGLVHGVVDGAMRGEYAELDDQGRYHLRMAYDRSGRTDLSATHPVRMMQPHAGAQYGMHFPLRPGADVLVGFVNGDPDRPIIVGTAPNPLVASPVAQSNQTQNVLRSGSRNELVMEDLRGSERVRVHSPAEDSTVQIGALEEPENGILLKTDANVSAVSSLSNNTFTARHAVIADKTTTVAGTSAVLVAGLPAIGDAAKKGMSDVLAVDSARLDKGLERLSAEPPREEEESDDDDEAQEPGVAATHFSEVAERSSTRSDDAALRLVRAAAKHIDTGLDSAQGRAQGATLGEPLAPAVIGAAERTAGLVGRDVVVLFGDRAAALGSADTASVTASRTAQLKSPGQVEVAGGARVDVTTPGELDVAVGDTARIVVGWYPDAEAPPLAEDVSLGIMSKKDMRIHSIEDCVIVCAKKHIIGTAHTGDIRLTAEKTIAMRAGSIVGSAGSVLFEAGNITLDASKVVKIKAGTKVQIEAPEVEIKAPKIELLGKVHISETLTVDGDSDL